LTRCIIPPSVLHGEPTAYEVRHGHDPGRDRSDRMALHGAAGQASTSGHMGRAYCASFSQLCLSRHSDYVFRGGVGQRRGGVRDHSRRNAGRMARKWW